MKPSTSLIRSLWVVLLAASSCAYAAEEKSCNLHPVASIDLIFGDSGPIMVPVTIEGHDLTMLLDTSTPMTWISEGASSQLALHSQPVSGYATWQIGGARIQRYLHVEGLKLGTSRFKEVDVGVNPLQKTWSAAEPAGVVGMPTIGAFDVDLDLAHHKLNLISTDHCPGKVVYWADAYQSIPMRLAPTGVYYFPMELNGRKIESVLSTGDPMTDLPADVSREVFNVDSNSPDVEIDKVADGSEGAVYKAMELTSAAGALKILNARVRLITIKHCPLQKEGGVVAYGAGCIGGAPLRLGFNVVSKLHLYLATKEKMLYFTSADAHH